MIYSNTKLLWPKFYTDSEYMIPKTADLRGVAFDPANQCIVSFDQTEMKLLWIQAYTGYVVQSAAVSFPAPGQSQLPNLTSPRQVVDICVIQDAVYILASYPDGVLAIYHGSLQAGRDTAFIATNEYFLPAYRQPQLVSGNIQSIFAATHDGSMRYLKYHPKYCSLFNKGGDLCLVLGLSNDITSDSPPEMGQWLVSYDLSGVFYKYYKMDDTQSYDPTKNARPLIIENKFNGLAVMACYHDGIVASVSEGIHPNDPLTGGLRYAKLLEDRTAGTGVLVPETHPFFVGSFRLGDSMRSAGRKMFTLAHNRLYQSDIYMLEVYTNIDGDIFSSSVDLGVVGSGQVLRRRVNVTNKSPYYTYSNLNIEVSDAKVSLAMADENGDPIPPFGERIKIPGDLPVGATATFIVQLTAPVINDENMVKTFHDRLSFKFESFW